MSLKHAIGARAAGRLLDAILGTVRFEVTGRERFAAGREQGPVIFMVWHGRLLPLTYLHRAEGLVALISRSADGEVIARVVEHWGYQVVRGSSSRGGTVALRELVRHARAGRSLAITPDGPRGPRQKMKPGALLAAQLTGAPLIPSAAGTARAWWFEGWDRFLVPKPFARIHVAYGAPVVVPRDADAAELARIGGAVEESMNGLVRAVDQAAAA
jgi:lysophospholipid acyltransferase (LPLAT)-like uncharacterized protein